MGYSIPVWFIRVSNKRSDNRQFDSCICATRIVAVMSTEIHQARKTIADERKNGTLINCCGLTKAKSAIFLDNGSVISSPLSVRRIMGLLNKGNIKANPRLDKKIRVYDVYDKDDDIEDEDEDEELTEDVSTEYEDEENEEEDLDDIYDDEF